MPKADIVKQLNLISQDARDWAKEAEDRRNEPQSHVQHLRQWQLINQMSLAIELIANVVKHEIDPHSDYKPKG